MANAVPSRLVDSVNGQGGEVIITETDPTVPQHVKDIAVIDISEWNEAFAKKTINISVTGTSTKTITLTKQDGTILTGTFSDMSGTEPTLDDVVNVLQFDETTGVLQVTTTEGNVITVTLDGRYSLIEHSHTADEIGETATRKFASPTEKTNWNTAFSWGDHEQAGYLKSFIEADPKGIKTIVVTGTTTKTITVTRNDDTTAIATFSDINTDTTYNSMLLTELNTGTSSMARSISAKTLTDWLIAKNYLTTESDPTVPSFVKNITQTNINNWNAAEQNVQSDWNATTGDEFIKNKPSLSNNITVRRVLIPVSALPANFTSIDVKNWLNTNESIGDNEVLFWETTGDTTAPTILTAKVENAEPNKLVVVFSEVVTITNTTGLTITGAATPTLSAPTGSGTDTITFTLSTALTNGQSVTLDVASSNTVKDAANNALTATTKAITNNVAAVASYEAETTSYMNTIAIADDANPSIYTGVSNNQVWVKVNDFISTLKTNSILTKCFRVYPKLGDTAIKQGIDMTTPTRSGTYGGSWVFNNKGAVANGSNTYFDSNVIPSSLALNSKDDFAITQQISAIDTALSSVNPQGFGALADGNSDLRIAMYVAISRDINKGYYSMGRPFSSVGVTTVSNAIHTLSRDSLDTAFYYNNGVEKFTDSVSNSTLGSLSIYEGGRNADTGLGDQVAANIGVSAYHKHLTASEISILHTAINTLEVALNRI